MSIPGKVLIALLSSFLVAGAATLLGPSCSFTELLLPAAIAALLAVVLSHRALPVPEAITKETPATHVTTSAARGDVSVDPRAASRGSGSKQSARDTGGVTRGKRRETPSERPRGQSGSDAAGRSQRRPAPDAVAARAERPVDAGDAAAAQVEHGTVKWFNVSKGYGFIVRGSGEEIFVHHRSVHGEGRGRLEDGARVRFRVATTDKGPQAEDVETL